ncbi:alpha/beta hydrolase [Actinoplanes sp. NPDC023714]|uniref:alpha/beta hydrolase family protein n=1 Tax=Actinoplanes sp. NPDC023714 TaxID=3154322 RepID=UPI0033D1A99D
MTISRRTLLAGALAVPIAARPGVAAASLPRLTLPAPTGPHRIGTRNLHLVNGDREMMASLWYPAAARGPRAPFMPVAPWLAMIHNAGFGTDAPPPLTAARLDAPPLPGRHPVVVYSHGSGATRAETTIVVQELASHGYAVVTIDHTGDGFSEFPDGRLSVPDDEGTTPWDSAADVLFVLDQLPRWGGPLDLTRIGMFGWSKGATATALVMNTDRRVRAGLALDGPMQSQPRPAAISRPFMLMTSTHSRTSPEGEPVEELWQQLRGWRLNVRTCGAEHSSYCDHQWLIPQLARLSGTSDEELASWIGTLDPGRAVRIQQAYPLAFFDQHLRGRPSRLLSGPSRAFPEIQFAP